MIWRLTTAVLAILAALAAIPAIRHLREQPPAPPPMIRAALEPPADAELGAGDDILDAAIAPDSGAIIFVATSAGVPRLWRRALDQPRAEPLGGTEGASLPAWKGGGQVVSFFADGRLRQVALADGAVRDLGAAPAPRGAAWLPDGSLLFAPDGRGPIRRLAGGGVSDATSLRGGDLTHAFPSAAGDGGDFLYIATLAGGRRVVRLRSGGGEIDLTRTSGHAAMIDDVLVHVSDGALTAQRFDRAGGSLVGRAARLAFDVGVAESGRAFFAASPRVLAWAAAAPRARELVWLDAAGQRTGTLSEPADYWQVRLSPDATTVAVTMLDPLLRTLDVFALPAGRAAAVPRRVSLSLSADSDPVWAPDGSRVVFRSMAGGQPNLLARPPRHSEEPDEVILRSDLDETASDWRAGTLLFHAPGRGTGLDIHALDVRSGQQRAVARGGFNESDARWSPDGRWLAYVSDESGQAQVMVEPWPQDGRKWRATSAGGSRPRWRRDSRAILFLRAGTLLETAVDVAGRDLTFAAARTVANLAGVRDYDAARSGDRVLAIMPGPRPASPRAELIVDWKRGRESFVEDSPARGRTVLNK